MGSALGRRVVAMLQLTTSPARGSRSHIYRYTRTQTGQTGLPQPHHTTAHDNLYSSKPVIFVTQDTFMSWTSPTTSRDYLTTVLLNLATTSGSSLMLDNISEFRSYGQQLLTRGTDSSPVFMTFLPDLSVILEFLITSLSLSSSQLSYQLNLIRLY